MTFIRTNYLKGFSVLFISLLAACNSDDKNTTSNSSNQKLIDETILSLQNLSLNLVWQENQCDSVYSKVINDANIDPRQNNGHIVPLKIT